MSSDEGWVGEALSQVLRQRPYYVRSRDVGHTSSKQHVSSSVSSHVHSVPRTSHSDLPARHVNIRASEAVAQHNDLRARPDNHFLDAALGRLVEGHPRCA